MNTERIVGIEDGNVGKIYLHREGMFLKAYDRSAFLVWKYISPFKLKRRFVKKVNRHVISLGFPEATKGKWLHGLPVKQLEDDLFVCEIEKPIDDAEYLAFEEEARVQTDAADRYTPRTSVIEKQAVYQTAVSLALKCLFLGRNIRKTDLVPYGNNLKVLSDRLAFMVGKLYDYPDRPKAVEKMALVCERLFFTLKMLKDAQDISEASMAEAGEMCESVMSQLQALKEPATTPKDWTLFNPSSEQQ